jgi:hypothetical protein
MSNELVLLTARAPRIYVPTFSPVIQNLTLSAFSQRWTTSTSEVYSPSDGQVRKEDRAGSKRELQKDVWINLAAVSAIDRLPR